MKNKIISIVSILTLFFLFNNFIVSSNAVFSFQSSQQASLSSKEYDFQSDPLVTKSYVDNELKKISEEIDKISKDIKDIKEGSSQVEGDGVKNLEVVELKPNQELIAYSGTEIILRSGEATALASELGGLSNLTIGEDISQGEGIPLNHLLLVPRSDNRGIKAETEVWVMVRGKYNIIK